MYYASPIYFSLQPFVKHQQLTQQSNSCSMKEYLMYMSVLGGIAIVYLVYALWQRVRLKRFTNQSK